MTSKSGFLVFILIASGCLSKACGDGQIGASPRNSEGARTPDQPNSDEPAFRAAGAPSTVRPYVHKTPADVGVTVGVGVIGPVPTETYTGSCTLGAGTLIENKVVNCGTIRLGGANIVIRNSILNLSANGDGSECVFFERGQGVNPTNTTMEYLDITCPDADKLFEAFNDGNGYDDYTGFTLRNSHLRGAHDYFFLKGQFDGLLIKDNVFAHFWDAPNPTGQRDDHNDAFQIAEGSSDGDPTTGTMTIQGNWFEHGWPFASKTALLFSTGDPATNQTDIIFESNRVTTWGFSPLWCADSDSCTFRYNVFSQKFRDTVGLRCNNSSCTSEVKDECCGWPMLAARVTSEDFDLACMRYENGDFLPQNLFRGNNGTELGQTITDCPAFTAP